jgi:AcrR family transcriptional regulator
VGDTKQRILDVTAELFRRYGYTGTGLKQIVANANAPFGSVYHHFPGGKQQLGGEVIRRSGQMYEDLVMTVFDAAPDPVTGTRDIFTGAAEVLKQTDYADACPIATVALEVASSNDALRQATADVFESWIAAAVERFKDTGISSRKARELAILLIEQLEGAFLLSRAMRTTEPMQIAGAAMVASVQAAIPRREARNRKVTAR